MATLAFAAAGAALGSSVLPAGLSVFGTTLTGAAIGSQIGALGGSFVDQALFSGSGQTRAYEGPRLTELQVTGSTEGAAIPKVYGRSRLGGQVIWAADIEEEVATDEAGGSGKGGLTGNAATTRVTYSYYASLAVGLCEGEIAGVGRIWVDGKELDQTATVFRVYTGSETQAPDSLITAIEGLENTPAYRGVAYVVFERLPLAPYGNRIPQFSFEIERPLGPLRELVRSIVVIPASGEFAYATTQVTRGDALGERVPENVHAFAATTDWAASIDQLTRQLPNVENVSLVTSWFGTDLRAGACELRPGIERREKETHPVTWRVAGETRATAHVVSETDGRPTYGGTPSDESVLQAIADLKARGIAVTLTPFILMDVPPGNALPDPYGGAAEQAKFPWRGRITLSPAPGVAGSPDKTAAAASQIASFVGSASASDFALAAGQVTYAGPAEWSYRRFILHHAYLALAAGGVDTFVIGTEMRGLTQARSAPAIFPFVEALVALAAEVKSILGPATKVTYAADWSEFFGYQPADGTGDVYFHLDPLWSSAAIDVIGIDMYWPLSDWRDGPSHLDREATTSVYDLAYLKNNLRGGEGYDWYYASPADRASQTRTDITDGAGKPWVFRHKDLAAWWSNPHYDRPAGAETAQPTAWIPASKPVWFMETGCPAVDKGANQPNVFYDPKSSESALPYFSEPRRDDLIQQNYIRAVLEGFDPNHPGAVTGLNPVSPIYGGPMLDPARIYVYAWDARPYPAFPANDEVWGDAPNWRYGHWLNGRIASAPLDAVVERILTDYGFEAFDASSLIGLVPGFVIERIMAAREALQPLELAFFFDAVESGDRIAFRHRAIAPPIAHLAPDDVVEERAGASLITLIRGQETELPAQVKLRYIGAAGDYRQRASESRRLAGTSRRTSEANLPLMLDDAEAGRIAECWLHETWVSRERARFVLPPSRLDCEPGDLIVLARDGREKTYRITEVSNAGARSVEARAIDPTVYVSATHAPRPEPTVEVPFAGSAKSLFMDLPLLRGDEPEDAGYVAVTQSPWPGSIAIFRSPASDGFRLAGLADTPAVAGTLATPLAPGVEGRLDFARTVDVVLATGELLSSTRAGLLDGANAAAVQNDAGVWEVIQFETATLVASRTYRLSGLLRGQAGTEDSMATPTSTGAPFVLLNRSLVRLDLAPGQIGLAFNWRFGPARYDIGHPSFDETSHAFSGRGRRPLSPVHVRGARDGTGDLLISWTRRTRIGGDSWNAGEVPLAETMERYEVDILDGAVVVRTLTAMTTAAVYSAAQQISDFGAPQPELSCRVYQVSPEYGRGIGRAALL